MMAGEPPLDSWIMLPVRAMTRRAQRNCNEGINVWEMGKEGGTGDVPVSLEGRGS